MTPTDLRGVCTSRALPAFVLLGAILAVYRPVFWYPYIQDDWEILARLAADPPSLVALFAPGPGFYRPLTLLTQQALHAVFGLEAGGFHVVALAVHGASALLLVRLVRGLGHGAVLAWAAGLVYATAAPVHMEPLLWMAGVTSLGSAFATLGGLVLIVEGWPGWGVVALGAGLLFWETPIAIPFALLLAHPRPPAMSRGVALYAALAALHVGLRLAFASPFASEASHPYAMRLFGSHLLANSARTSGGRRRPCLRSRWRGASPWPGSGRP